MYPSFTSLSDRHRQQKSLLQRLELESKINKIQSDAYSIADWNGTSFVSLAPPAAKISLSTQTDSTARPLQVNTSTSLSDGLAQFERSRAAYASSPSSVVSTPSSVRSLPTTRSEIAKVEGKITYMDELRANILNPRLRRNNRNRTDPMEIVSPPQSNVSMGVESPPQSNVSMGSSEGYETPDERLRLRMLSEGSMSSEAPSVNTELGPSASDQGSPSGTQNTATTYLGTIANIEYDDVPPTARELSAKDSDNFVKALLDPSKVSGSLYERIIKEPVMKDDNGSEIPFKPISKATGKHLISATWDPKLKFWVSRGNRANVDEIKTFMNLWTVIKNNFDENPNKLLRERNTLKSRMQQTSDQVGDAVATGLKRGGRVVHRGRFNHLTYKTIGARKVHLPSLQSGYLSVRHMNGTMSGRKTKISDQLLKLIREFVFDDHINQQLYDTLEVDDQTIFSELLKATRIQNTLKDGWANPKEALKARYDKLLGELNLGNDSVVPELKKVIVDMFSQGMISDKQFKQLFEHVL